MANVHKARVELRDIVRKMMTIVDDPKLTDAEKMKRLDTYEPDLKAAQEKVWAAETIEARKAEIFGGTDPSSANPTARYYYPGGATSGHTVKRGAAPPLSIPEPALKALHAAAIQRRSLRLDLDTPDLDFKGPNDPEDWSGVYVPPVLMPPLLGISEPNRVAALFPAVPMTGPSVEYVRITGRSGQAAVVAPGARKPDIGLLSEKLDARAVKIAGTCTVQDESLEDFASFAAVVSAELQRAVTDAENTELLSGNGNTNPDTGPLHMLGILNTPGLLTRTTATGETAADTLEQAITDLRVGPSYAEADAVVFHPTDWSAIRRLKDSTGRYLVDQDPTTAGSLSLWGTPVKITTVMPQGTAIVGRYALGGVLHVRRGLTVEVANTNNDDFERNRTTFRAEIREVLATTRPTAFVKVNLTPTQARARQR